MPTTRPRYQVTETPDVARALDNAARRWPGEPRSKLLLLLVREGGAAVAGAREEAKARRLAAIDRTAAAYPDAFGRGYLARLREDWPE